MKLLDILASEMKDWPSTRTGAVGQSESGSLHLNQDARHGSDFFGWTTFKFQMAEDWKTAWVTRAEWQAAVDALNAPKVVEWDGEDTPAVGVICEFHESTSGWNSAVVKYSSDHCVVLERDNGYELCIFTIFPSRSVRPIRTAEQVAAEEREKVAEELYTAVMDCQSHWPSLQEFRKEHYRSLVDAGWQKVAK